MNLFILDKDPVIAAQMNCDSHVRKITVECFQMLGSALRRHGATDDIMPLTSSGNPLLGGYHNHPVTRWVGGSRDNFEWTISHGLGLAREFTYRFNKIHACQRGIHQMSSLSHLVPAGQRTDFAQAMPDIFKSISAVLAYRNYYWCDKRVNIRMSWTRRERPNWWKILEEHYL